MLTTTVYDDIIGKPTAQQAAPQQATETTAQAAAPQAGVATQVADTPVTNTAAAPAETATQQTAQTTQAVAQPTQQKTPMNYADMFVAMNPYKPMTPEERAAEAKRNRRNAMFAAISDGISALSNLYFTTKGAPNSFNGGSTLSGKMYERQRQLEKEREAMDKDYINGYLRAMEMDRNRDNAERNYQQQLRQLQYNMQRNAEMDNMRREEHEWKRNEQDPKMREREANANRAETRARLEEPLTQSKIDKNNRTGTGTKAKTTTPKAFKGFETMIGGSVVRIPESKMSKKTVIEQAAEAAGLTQRKGEKDSVFEARVKGNPAGKKKIEELVRKYGEFAGDEQSGRKSSSLLPSSGNNNTSLLPQQ